MKRSFWSTIRGKLLSRTLLVVLVPVLVIGTVAVVALGSISGTTETAIEEARVALSQDVVGNRAAEVSEQIAREVAIFLDERLSDAEVWSADAGFVAAAKAAAERADELGLTNMSIDEAEALYEDNPRLGDSAVEQDLANAVLQTPAFKEILITDVNGFNIDYSTETLDFVQSDEGWWTRAIDSGIDISEPEFDDSTGVYAVDIAIRLEDNGRPVGVVKAALDVDVLQIIADRFADRSDSFEVSIVDSSGNFLAETAEGHIAEHIAGASTDADHGEVSNDLVRDAFATEAPELHPDGYSIDGTDVAGFAHVDDELASLRGDMGTTLGAFDWTVVVEQPSDIAFASLGSLESLASDVSTTTSSLRILLLLVAAGGMLAAALMALVFGRRLTSPITRLRDAAVEAAEVTLPNVVAQIDALEPDQELPQLEPLLLVTGDEVEDLAHSFNTVQQTAADLAAQQARMRRKNVATTFVNLGRRNQNLLSRQLEHINSMEDSETNSDTLQRLFQLDHLATRMRRNAESLLVLAGEETPRRFRQPVSMHQLLQAAGGEIEDFGRIELTTLDDASVEGGAASDIAHLLAELLENASSFSPPGTPIQVHGRRRENGYRLAIIDQGIGMAEADLAAANTRLADPAEFDRAPSAFLGHFVVGHLAKRHGIRVRVTDSPYGGIAAQLHLPLSVLATTEVAELAPAAPVVTAALPAVVAPPAAPQAPDPEVTDTTTSDLAEIAALELALLDEAAEVVRPSQSPPSNPVAQTQRPAHTADAVDPMATVDQAIAEATVAATVEPAELTPVGAPTTPGQATGSPASPETTPSGFRRRRRGHEGAPEPLAPTDTEVAAPKARRSPEEVQASLQRFRQGVEAGRAQTSQTDPQTGDIEYGGESR